MSDAPQSEQWDFARQVFDDATGLRPEPNLDLGPGATDFPAPVNPISTVATSSLFDPSAVRKSAVADMLSVRRSERSLGPVGAAEVVAVLTQVFALQGFAPADDGAIRRFRPVPSAGARHPLVPLLLVEQVAGLDGGLWRYAADADLMYRVAVPQDEGLTAAWESVCSAGGFDRRPAAVAVLAAKFDATLSRYPQGATLVWRDAGVALGYLHLAATAMGLGSCMLGTAGLLSEDLLVACGVRGTLVGDVGALALGSTLGHVS